MSCLHSEFADGRCVVCGIEVPSWAIDAAELLAEGDPGATDMLVDGLIVDRALIAAVGRWKTTKSYGMLDISISVATGLPAFGAFGIPEPGPVVFVNEESGRRALWRMRCEKGAAPRGSDPHPAPEDTGQTVPHIRTV